MRRNQSMLLLIIAGAIIIGTLALFSNRGQAAPINYDTMPPLVQPDLTPLPTAAPAPALEQRPAGSSTLFSTTFDEAKAQDVWTAVDLEPLTYGDEPSRWSVREGRLHQDWAGELRTPVFRQTAAVTGDPAWQDYTLRANVYAMRNDEIGLLFRVQGNSHYRFRLASSAYPDPRLVLEKVVEGKATPLAQLDHPGYTTNTWYTLQADIVGANITISINNEPVIKAQDSSLTAGKVGVYGIATGDLFYDDVTVTTVQK